MTDNPLLLIPEENLLLSLCSLQFSDEQKTAVKDYLSQVTDWEYFVRLTEENGIIALCHYNLTGLSRDISIPDEISGKLHKGYIASLARNTRIFEHLNKVLALASEEKIEVVILKGLALEKTIYGNQGLRQMNDLDILVNRTDAIRLRNLLLMNGFASKPMISSLHEKILPSYGKHLPEMYKDGLSVEIHFKLFDEKGDSLTQQFISSSSPYSKSNIKNTEYRIPNTEYLIPDAQSHFLYLVKHLHKHESVGTSQLRLYADLAILLSLCKEEILKTDLYGNAVKAGIEKALIEKLFLLKEFWDIDTSASAFPVSEPTDKNKVIEKFIHFLRHPKEQHEDLQTESLLKPMKDIEGSFNKLLFILGNIFPSLTYMKYRYSAKTRFYALFYYPVRWAKMVRLIFSGTL